MASILIAAKVPPDLASAVRLRAEQSDRTLSAEIRRALRAHLATPEMSEAPATNEGSAKTATHRRYEAG